jgi:hypothetical protein
MRVRRLIWLFTISLALVGTPGSALADRHHYPNPDPRPLWRVYPLGTQPLVKGGTAPATAGTHRHSKLAATAPKENTFLIGFTQILVGTALLCTLAAVIPIAMARRRFRSRNIAAGANRRRALGTRGDPKISVERGAAGAVHRQVPRVKPSLSVTSQPAALTGSGGRHPSTSPSRLPRAKRSRPADSPTQPSAPRAKLARPPIDPFAAFPSRDQLHASPRNELFAMARTRRISNIILMSREELIEALTPANHELTEPQPARSTRPTATPDEAILRYAAAYAHASQRGDPAPMAAVRAIIPPITKNPAGYAKRMIAEARRRDLLTSHGRGKARGELTPKALELMKHSAASRARPTQSRGGEVRQGR